VPPRGRARGLRRRPRGEKAARALQPAPNPNGFPLDQARKANPSPRRRASAPPSASTESKTPLRPHEAENRAKASCFAVQGTVEVQQPCFHAPACTVEGRVGPDRRPTEIVPVHRAALWSGTRRRAAAACAPEPKMFAVGYPKIVSAAGAERHQRRATPNDAAQQTVGGGEISTRDRRANARARHPFALVAFVGHRDDFPGRALRNASAQRRCRRPACCRSGSSSRRRPSRGRSGRPISCFVEKCRRDSTRPPKHRTVSRRRRPMPARAKALTRSSSVAIKRRLLAGPQRRSTDARETSAPQSAHRAGARAAQRGRSRGDRDESRRRKPDRDDECAPGRRLRQCVMDLHRNTLRGASSAPTVSPTPTSARAEINARKHACRPASPPAPPIARRENPSHGGHRGRPSGIGITRSGGTSASAGARSTSSSVQLSESTNGPDASRSSAPM